MDLPKSKKYFFIHAKLGNLNAAVNSVPSLITFGTEICCVRMNLHLIKFT